MQGGGAGQESGDLREDGSGWQDAHEPRCSRFQLKVRFLVLVVILEAAALVLQSTHSFEFVEQLQLLEHMPWFAGLAINVTGRALGHVRPRSPTGAHPDTAAAEKSHGVAGPTKNRGTRGAPFKGCVFLMSPVTFKNSTPAYREAFVQWHADFLMTSLGAQTNSRFTALVGPSFSPSETAMVREFIDYKTSMFRLRPPSGVVFLPGSRFLSRTTRS